MRIRMRTASRCWAFLTTTIVATAILSGPAQAEFGVAHFDGEVINRDGNGLAIAATQAASHPAEASTRIDFRSLLDPDLGMALPEGSVRNIRVELPPGFVGNPTAAATCTEPQLELPTPTCPPDSQVGVVTIESPSIPNPTIPVFNMVPPPGVPGAFGFNVGGLVPVHLRATVRSGTDYGLNIDIININQTVPITATSLTFWGVPADPSHDLERVGGPTGSPRRAFLTNPTRCNGPLETRLRITAWDGATATSSFISHAPAPDQATLLGPDRCDLVPFDARLDVSPQQTQAGAPSGFTFDLSIPQNDDPDGLAQGHLKRAVVRLPAGLSIGPPSAAGLEGCSDEQAGLGNAEEPTCPEASRIGSLRIDTPLLSRPMTGSIYLGAPKPGNLFRLLLVARGPGVVLKLPGTVEPDKLTGELTTTFDNNPQLPFSNLHLQFKDGPRAPLSLPRACGKYTTSAELTSWSGKTVTSNSEFTVSRDGRGAPCPPLGFTPYFSAGLANPMGGSSSDFSLTFAREDEDATLRDITVDLPEGLTGMIASADLCPEALAASGACGERSLVGSTTTGAGSGSNPFFLNGRVYITGPYKGAPYGMSIVVPAIAGPFDLGTVVVRAAIFVDRRTARLRIVSDPLPTILEGVPLLIRKVDVTIDKTGFMLAPTSCAPKRISAQIGSNEGLTAAVGSRFQVGSCASLPFKPRMSLRIGGRGRTRPGITVPFQTVVNMTPGQANIRSVRVNLPDNINARLQVINRNSCSLAAYEASRCPASLAVGNAVATTPLLKDPLRGNAYFVRNPARRIPDLMVALKGQVDIDLAGKISIPRDLTLATTFDTVPDVPITRFTLNLVAGRSGPIGTIGNLCAARVRSGMKAKLVFRGQNGNAVVRSQKMSIAGCGRRAATRARRGRSRGGRRTTTGRGSSRSRS